MFVILKTSFMLYGIQNNEMGGETADYSYFIAYLLIKRSPTYLEKLIVHNSKMLSGL